MSAAGTRNLMRLILTMVEQSAVAAARVLPSCDAAASWQELANKVQAFRTFEHVDAIVGLPLWAPLPQLVARAAELPSPLSVWAAEGIAYHVTAARCAHDRPRHLLQRHDLPPSLSIPLHAGMGSAIAASLVQQSRRASGAEIRRLLVAFEAACMGNAEKDHLGVALEALGFVVQSLYRELLPEVVAVMLETRPILAPFFWHGAGRAMYFAPSSCFGCTALRTVERQFPRASVEGLNTVAGYSWAATLVNLRHPAVVEPLVESAVESAEAMLACGVGMRSALNAWALCAPCDPALGRFVHHVPATLRSQRAWRQVVDATPPPTIRCAGDLFALPGAVRAGGIPA